MTFELLEPRVAQENTRLDIGNILRSLVLHCMEICRWILKAGRIPCEHTALVSNAGISRGKMETVNRKAFLLNCIDKAKNRIVAVPLQLRIIHGTSLVAQRALGQQSRSSG